MTNKQQQIEFGVDKTTNADQPDQTAVQQLGLILIGMPVAYALGLSALIGAWWIDIPYQALMIQIAGGVNKFR